MSRLARTMLIWVVLGVAVPVFFLGLWNLDQNGHLIEPQSRLWVENAMLILWPSSVMNMPFPDLSIVVLAISVTINACAYAGLGASFFCFWNNHTLASLLFPLAFLAAGLLLAFS